MTPIITTLARQVGIAATDELPVYAWPGGYPLYYLDGECNVLCPTCAGEDRESLIDADANWEDEAMYCDQCSGHIPSAYGDDEE